MSRSRRVPAYGLHKATGQARVVIDGKTHYLGLHGSDESRARYRELIDAWRSRQSTVSYPDVTCSQLAMLDLACA